MNNKEVTQLHPRMLSLPYLGICVLTMIVILINLSFKLHLHKRQSNETSFKFYKIVTIISISAFAFASLIDFIDLIHYFATGIDVIETKKVWLITLTNVFYGFSAVTLYMIVFGKLYFTLQISPRHKLHKSVVIYMVTMIIVIGILIQVFALLILSLYSDRRVFFYQMLDTIFWIVAIFDFILTASIIIMFVYKLFDIIKDYSATQNDFQNNTKNNYYQAGYDKDDYDTHVSSEDIDIEEIIIGNGLVFNLNEDQVILLKIITRHCILCAIAIISNQIFYGSVLYCSGKDYTSEQQLCFTVYSNIIKSTQGVINAVALYLNFAFNDSLYRKWCCCCHVSCYKCLQCVFKRIMYQN